MVLRTRLGRNPEIFLFALTQLSINLFITLIVLFHRGFERNEDATTVLSYYLTNSKEWRGCFSLASTSCASCLLNLLMTASSSLRRDMAVGSPNS